MLPALSQPECKERLPRGLRIGGFADREYSEGLFREHMGEGVREFGEVREIIGIDLMLWTRWAKLVRGNILVGQSRDYQKNGVTQDT